MATGKRSTNSVTKSSDGLHSFRCLPCSKDRVGEEATHKCIECQIFYCKTCLEGHNKFVRKHTILETKMLGEEERDTIRNTASLTVLSDETCHNHPSKAIDMYCRDHDDVYCAVCIALDHRSCHKVEYIPDIATELLQGKDKEKWHTYMDEVTSDLKELKTKQTAFLTEMNQKRNGIVKNIRAFSGQLVKRIEEIERSSISVVEEKYEANRNEIKQDVKKVDKMLIDIELYRTKAEQNQQVDDAKAYVTMRLAELCASKGKTLTSELFGKHLSTLDYFINQGMRSYLDYTSMGRLQVLPILLAPFVRILISSSAKLATSSFIESLQADLLADGIRSRTFTEYKIDDDLYTIVVFSDISDTLTLYGDSKLIYLWLKEKTGMVGTLMEKSMFHMKRCLLDEHMKNRSDIIAFCSTPIFFERSEEGVYIFNQADKSGALQMISQKIKQW